MNSLNRFDKPGEDHSSLHTGRPLIHQKINLGTAGLVAFSGCSMKPTLVDGDLVEMRPYDPRTAQVGDIIYYQLPEGSKAIIHRLVRITPTGVIARGDNNSFDDEDPIPLEFILGQVTAAWRGPRRRQVPGGRIGIMYYKFYQITQTCGSVIFFILRPFYQILVRWQGFAQYMPQRFRPKIVVFKDGKETHLRLVWWKRVIGEYNFFQRRWTIYRPFRLLVSDKIICSNKPLQGVATSTTIPQSGSNN